MTDWTEEELVRRMKGGPKNLIIGILIGICLTAVIGLLLGPIIAQRSIRETFPKMLEPGPEKPAPVPAEAQPVDLSLPKDAPAGALRTASQTVIVSYTTMDGNLGTIGSGLLIRDGIILTAAHLHPVRVNDMRIGVYCNGRAAEGWLLKQSEVRDISVIKAPPCEARHPVRISTKRLRPEDMVFVSGFVFAFDGRKTWARRYFESSAPAPDARLDTDVLEDDAAKLVKAMRANRIPELTALWGMGVPGQSGSPVFLESGDIVGMFVISYPRRSQRFMVPAVSIARILKNIGIDP